MRSLESTSPQPTESAHARIRKLRHGERDALRAHLLRLTPADRRLRFLGSASDAAIARYCDGPEPLHAIVLGYFVGDTLRAAGELLFHQDLRWSRCCEVALSVEQPFQGKGVGTELLRRLTVIARNRGAASIVMWCLSENRKMRAVATKIDARLSTQDGELGGTLWLAWPTHFSLMQEALEDGRETLRLVLGLDEPRETQEAVTTAPPGGGVNCI